MVVAVGSIPEGRCGLPFYLAPAQRSPPLGVGPVRDRGGDPGVAGYVGTDEDDPRPRLGWLDADGRLDPGMQADPRHLGRPRDRPLLARGGLGFGPDQSRHRVVVHLDSQPLS